MREPFNTITHGLGVLLSIAGLVYLVVAAKGALAVTAFTIYGASLILLYGASTTYHALPLSERGLRILKRIDHTAIYLLIAGTYTPICLLAVSPAWGWSIFGVVWGLAIAGIVGKNLWLAMPKWLSTGLYIAMGWTALVAAVPLAQAFPWHGLALLIAGGVAYTMGAVVYATGWLDVARRHVGSHGVWHIFVMAGSALHYAFIVGYVA